MTFLRIVIPLELIVEARSFPKPGSHLSGSCSGVRSGGRQAVDIHGIALDGGAGVDYQSPKCRPQLRSERTMISHIVAYPSRSRASFAPAPSATSLAAATSLRIGAMPQLVHGMMRSRGT